MFVFLYKWIRRLAQGKVQPLPEPSIGTRRTLRGASTGFRGDLRDIRAVGDEPVERCDDPYAALRATWMLLALPIQSAQVVSSLAFSMGLVA